MTNDKTLGVVVTIEATTDLEPNYFIDHSFDNDADPTFKPKTVTLVTRGYMEVNVGQEHLALLRLHEALQSAEFDEVVTEGPYFTVKTEPKTTKA